MPGDPAAGMADVTTQTGSGASFAPTEVFTPASTQVPAGAPIELRVEVQFAAALVTALPRLPAAAEIEGWAQHTFALASVRGWDSGWRDRIGAAGETPVAIEYSPLCVRLVDATEGETLNATWRNKHAPTNVLSFAADMVAGQSAPLGDLVLCAPVLEREAEEHGKSVAHHCAHLVVHGVLHLLGFDHLIETEAEAMEAMEAAVLGELGISNPYE